MNNISMYLINASLILLVIRQIREHPLDSRSLATPVLAVGCAAVGSDGRGAGAPATNREAARPRRDVSFFAARSVANARCDKAAFADGAGVSTRGGGGGARGAVGIGGAPWLTDTPSFSTSSFT